MPSFFAYANNGATNPDGSTKWQPVGMITLNKCGRGWQASTGANLNTWYTPGSKWSNELVKAAKHIANTPGVQEYQLPDRTPQGLDLKVVKM